MMRSDLPDETLTALPEGDYPCRDNAVNCEAVAGKLTSESMISQKAKYALRALVALARAEDPAETMMISDIAERQNIPKKFLEQILLDLKHHGIVASKRGKAGGYLMLRRPNEITFGEVLRIIDGPIAPLPCLSRMAYRRCEDCTDETSCEVRRVFARVADATRSVLDQTTLADSIAGEDAKADALLAG
jgi:Rrf2 family protein